MAEVPKTPIWLNVEGGLEQPATGKRADSITNPLPDLLQNLTTREPVKVRTCHELQGTVEDKTRSKVRTCDELQEAVEYNIGFKVHTCDEFEEAVEYNTIASKINHRLRLEKRDGAIEEYYTLPDGSQYTKHANRLSETLDELKRYALPFPLYEVENFIVRHEDVLPNGRKTCRNLMSRIMNDMLFMDSEFHKGEELGETEISSKEPANPGHFWTLSKTIQELRDLITVNKHAEKDLLSLVMIESEVTTFYDRHARQILRNASSNILRRAAIDLRVELIQKKECERSSKDKRERDDLISAMAIFRRCHQLRSEGNSVEEAMRIVTSKAPEDKKKTDQVLSTLVSKDIEEDVNMLSTTDDESDDHDHDGLWRPVSCSDGEEIEEMRRSPKRPGSLVRSTSPSKKGKVSPTKQVKYFNN